MSRAADRRRLNPKASPPGGAAGYPAFDERSAPGPHPARRDVSLPSAHPVARAASLPARTRAESMNGQPHIVREFANGPSARPWPRLGSRQRPRDLQPAVYAM